MSSKLMEFLICSPKTHIEGSLKGTEAPLPRIISGILFVQDCNCLSISSFSIQCIWLILGFFLHEPQRFRALRSGGISKPKRSANIQISIEVQNLNFARQPA